MLVVQILALSPNTYSGIFVIVSVQLIVSETVAGPLSVMVSIYKGAAIVFGFQLPRKKPC
jgi:hypothetical protein